MMRTTLTEAGEFAVRWPHGETALLVRVKDMQ